jgi:dGTPase
MRDYALTSSQSRGRRYPEPAHRYRSDYQRDRDRIVHSRAFRRLENKTQVFTTRFSDHFRNRLTHTIEVSQISRTIAGVLGLNEHLVEALALVHDIGHPPFGHAGERVLNRLMQPFGESFDHNLQALRIVESFEQRYAEFPGLNLTFEVREGIIKHSRDYSPAHHPDLVEYLLDQRPPLEAQLIDLADEVAYNTADMDDGMEAKLLNLDSLRAELPVFERFYQEVIRRWPAAPAKMQFNEVIKQILNYMATDLIENSAAEIARLGIQTVADVRACPHRIIGFSKPVVEEKNLLKKYLFRNFYSHPALAADREAGLQALEGLFHLYMNDPERMPRGYADLTQKQPLHRVVCDYIAGMTDPYILRLGQEQLGTVSAPAISPRQFHPFPTRGNLAYND